MTARTLHFKIKQNQKKKRKRNTREETIVKYQFATEKQIII
jgi:hypothetical protein